MRDHKSENYIKPLDGLRVLSLIGVTFYHLYRTIVPSGYLGVVTFFVLAGFLSMQQISGRYRIKVNLRDALIKIKDKYLKLLPPLLLVVLAVSIVMTVFFKNFLKSYPSEGLSSILFVNNIAQIFNNESYFDAMNSIKPLTHLWALSLEMQFYIVFFICIFTTYKYEHRKVFLGISALLFFISQGLTFYAFQSGSSLTRIYYGLDTRLNAFLIGVITSVLLTYVYSFSANKALIKMVEVIVTIPIIFLFFFSFNTDLSTITVLIVYSILSSILIFCLSFEHKYSFEKSFIYKVFSSKIFDYLSDRSYVIYLVHYPIAIFANRYLAHMKVNYFLYATLLIPIIIIVSEILYRINEALFVKTKSKKIPYILLCIILFITSALLVYDTRYDTYEEPVYETFDDDIEEEIIEKEALSTGTYDIDSYTVQRVIKYIDRVNNEIGADATLTYEDFYKYHNMKIALVGDSVSECAKHAIELYFPDSYIDAESNRQYTKAYDIFTKLKENNGTDFDVAVIALGTNSDRDINVEDIEKVYYAAEGKPVVLTTIVTPLLQEEQKRNNVIRNFAKSHNNCFIADWYSIMKTHSECFMSDSTHPKDAGTLAFAQIIFKSCINAIEGEGESVYINKKFQYLTDANVCDVVKFGSYYIESEKKKSPIEWIVVEKNDDIHMMFLVAKEALNVSKYHDEYISISWSKSKLRKWLNGEFLNEAFSSEERDYIRERTIENSKNPKYTSLNYEDTKDRVFVLSEKESKKHLRSTIYKCKATKYAISNGVYVDQDGYCDWWLRTTGDKSSNVMYVSSDEEIVYEGDYCTTDDFGVRPAIYIRYD